MQTTISNNNNNYTPFRSKKLQKMWQEHLRISNQTRQIKLVDIVYANNNIL